ncbi:MAG: YigZ family protein [Victivallales bacterium]|nr:YigZ family protein [Victivallales bacterium]
MLILKEGGRTEIVIKRSRFIADLMSVDTQEGARELLRSLKEQWALLGINHLVHAFIVGPGANIMGCSDDGEPSGTAGRPVLEVLKGTGMTNVMLTVARYFGGIKLGTGGLVKAYTESAQSVVALAKTAELVPMVSFSISCQYPYYERIKLILAAQDATIDGEDFGTEVTIKATSKKAVFDEIALQCRDISRGQARVVVSD